MSQPHKYSFKSNLAVNRNFEIKCNKINIKCQITCAKEK